MARPRKPAKRKPAVKRQPKRILNCKPSPKSAEDWTFQTAEEAALERAASMPGWIAARFTASARPAFSRRAG